MNGTATKKHTCNSIKYRYASTLPMSHCHLRNQRCSGRAAETDLNSTLQQRSHPSLGHQDAHNPDSPVPLKLLLLLQLDLDLSFPGTCSVQCPPLLASPPCQLLRHTCRRYRSSSPSPCVVSSRQIILIVDAAVHLLRLPSTNASPT